MDSGKRFAVDGPNHLMAKTGDNVSSPTKTIEIDWDNEEHHRCITACLVNGSYIQEGERTKWRRNDNTSEELAPAWWESFHYSLYDVLECHCDCLVCKIHSHCHFQGVRTTPFDYGAIFKYVPPDGTHHHSSAPRYIVVFRGTMLGDPTTLGDMCLNLQILINEQHNCKRFCDAREEVGKLLNSIPNKGATSNCLVWLAGHSLGASIALDVGRDMMARNGLNLPTFLFNPPQVSLHAVIDKKLPMAEVVTRGLHTSSYLLKHGLGKVLKPHKKNMEEQFKKLSSWVPNLYVHQRDIICKGFIDYFEQRERVQEQFPRVAASGTMLSYRDICRSVFGMQNERPHLLPSATLWKNQSAGGDPHELRQWWQPQGPELVLTHRLYKWPA